VTAYLQRNDHNILFCDWGHYSRQFYFSVVLPELYDIGVKIAKHLKEFFDAGGDVKKFHLVGHSLGEIT
jgi:pimeloyl-ACP methyl ester carboxylesterase